MANISLPITDRRRAHDFYANTFNVEAIGPIAEDGLAEPLRFDISGTSVLLIPTGGFNWVLGDLELSGRGKVSCLLVYGVDDDAGVDELTERAADRGGSIVLQPIQAGVGDLRGELHRPRRQFVDDHVGATRRCG